MKDGRPFADVLHCAMYAEGQGGDEKLIRWLLPRVELRMSDGKAPLHMAYSIGKPKLVFLLRHWTEKRAKETAKEKGFEKGFVETEDDFAVAPLSAGIRGRMGLVDLILCAEPTARSLRIFMEVTD